ncbi:PaaX family transcriptional regulator C-terminal domain-containing protein [Actinokineospora auranticolor]|uniref:Phenylacetic acid degradation operon negative regulatory protein n=1 Tax=Actinokineospora auranticolor TaxID=155976 RepID=A0A2S6GED9_9PSEU|nr:PaaX family transcriptional regulator C-terminal domain-containing protein [Actinokineospora auranticolor]PPK63603.1 phenylacetic acid degradation operon negative regulatory protein [Actinokineospora auranticolor]
MSTKLGEVFDPAPQDLVLTILGAHLRPRDRTTVWSGGLVSLLVEFGFTPGAARVALTRLVQRDLLERVRDGRMVHYRLTDRAAAVLVDGDRRIFTVGTGVDPARGQWTVLWHAIPEEQRVARTRLVRRLRFLGFGPVQDGTWLAPRDRVAEVDALLADLGVTAHAGVLLGAPAGAGDFADFARRVWDLAALAARYEAFVAEFAPAREPVDDPRTAFHLRVRLIHVYRQFATLDPELPEDLVPAPPHRAAAVALFHDAYPVLAAPAQHHFDEAMKP